MSVVNARRIFIYREMIYEKLGDTRVKAIRKIQQAFGDDAINIRRFCKKWHTTPKINAYWKSELVSENPQRNQNNSHWPNADSSYAVSMLIETSTIGCLLTIDAPFEQEKIYVHA